jgi:hypothetical protein
MDRKPNKKRKIPFQARRLVREVLSGKHKTIKSAGEAAGYSGTDAHRALRNLQGTMSEILDAAGMTDAFLAQNCLKPLLRATTTKFFQYEGEVTDSRKVADNDARLRALDIALRIKGKYAPLAVEQAHKHAVQVLILDVPRPKRDIPPPTMIEIAKRELPPNGNGHNGNRSNGGQSLMLSVRPVIMNHCASPVAVQRGVACHPTKPTCPEEQPR